VGDIDRSWRSYAPAGGSGNLTLPTWTPGRLFALMFLPFQARPRHVKLFRINDQKRLNSLSLILFGE